MREDISRQGAKEKQKLAKSEWHSTLCGLSSPLCAFARNFFPCLLLLLLTACQSNSNTSSRGIIIVNSPATGEVRRVLVREGASVNEGAELVEIAIISETPAVKPSPGEDPQKRAARTVESAQAGIETARAEVVRTEVEVNRLTPLVASGDAPQAQLDGARAEYERAQQRLRQAQTAAQEAQAGLVAARQPTAQNSSQPAPAAPTEQIVTARASSAGTVSAISIQPGQRVTAGQPLATLRAE